MIPFGGLVVNRVVTSDLADCDEDELRDSLESRFGPTVGSTVADVASDTALLARRDREAIDRLARELGDADPCVVPDLGPDVRDAAGLVALQRHLFGD